MAIKMTEMWTSWAKGDQAWFLSRDLLDAFQETVLLGALPFPDLPAGVRGPALHHGLSPGILSPRRLSLPSLFPASRTFLPKHLFLDFCFSLQGSVLPHGAAPRHAAHLCTLCSHLPLFSCATQPLPSTFRAPTSPSPPLPPPRSVLSAPFWSPGAASAVATRPRASPALCSLSHVVLLLSPQRGHRSIPSLHVHSQAPLQQPRALQDWPFPAPVPSWFGPHPAGADPTEPAVTPQPEGDSHSEVAACLWCGWPRARPDAQVLSPL